MTLAAHIVRLTKLATYDEMSTALAMSPSGEETYMLLEAILAGRLT